MARGDAQRNRERIVKAAGRLLAGSPGASLADIATAAGVSRSTIYRHFPTRGALIEAVGEPPRTPPPGMEGLVPAGRMGRSEPLPLDPIHVLDAVAPPLLPQQLVAEAQRLADVPLALYVLDIDGSHLLRIAGPERLPERIEAPLAIGPELDVDGLELVRERLDSLQGVELTPLWLRGRAIGVMLSIGRPHRPLEDLARQASAAIVLADRYTDAFARAQRRKQPKAAAEIQQSLLPPRIARFSGGEVAGNVLPSYEVAGDWFDAVENPDGIWLTLANGLGGGTRSIASAAVALGALRAARRSGATPTEALMVMHRTLQEMPGPRTEMTAVTAHWDPVTQELRVANCGHVPPVIIRAGKEPQHLRVPRTLGLGGRSAPRPEERTANLTSGDRLVLVSDGVVRDEEGKAGLGIQGVIDAADRAKPTAADTVRRVHVAVLDAAGGELDDDATAVCLAVR